MYTWLRAQTCVHVFMCAYVRRRNVETKRNDDKRISYASLENDYSKGYKYISSVEEMKSILICKA
jgi:hypothetical protein